MKPPFNDVAIDALRSQPDVLIAFIQKQARHIEQILALNSALLNENTSLRLQVHALNERVRQLEEQNHPPAAPFGRKCDKPSTGAHGKPGRKPGHAPAWKQPPAHIDEHIEAPLEPRCPHCSSALQAIQPLVQHIEELVPAQKHVTCLRTHQGWCPKCEQVMASTHPRQVSFAGGAAGTHLGAHALATACWLKHGLGLSFAKTSEALRQMGGITISPGGLAQLFQRVAGKVKNDYEALREQLLQSPGVHADETSWYVGKRGSSLWVFCNSSASYYEVVENKNREKFNTVIPSDWPGVVVSDCLGVYDNATPHQQKCYAHHLKAIKRAVEAGGLMEQGSYLWRWKQLLRQAMKLAKGWWKRAPPQREQHLRALKLAAEALLESPLVDKPQEEAVRIRLSKQKDHLFVFLEKPGVEATNNLAERQLRPAVIARKISCGQRTWKGAGAWQVLTSLSASARQTASSFIELVKSRCPVAAC